MCKAKGRMQAINKVRADFQKAACPTARQKRPARHNQFEQVLQLAGASGCFQNCGLEAVFV